MKTKVYWCHTFSEMNPNELMGFKPEPLLKAMQNDLDWLDNKDMFRCGSMMSDVKSAFVCRASYDMTLRFSDEGFWLFPDNTIMQNLGNDIVQFHNNYGFTFLSENIDTTLTITPPFMHDTAFNRGISGTLNCGKWLRFVGASIIKQDKTPIVIKRGDPIMYIYFNRDVQLIQVKETDSIRQLVNKCLNVKNYQENTPLNKLYDMFVNSGYRKMALKEMKGNVV